MTQQATAKQPHASQVVEMPPAEMPVTNRVVTDNPFPVDAKQVQAGAHPDQPVLWVVNNMHPFVPDMKIIRMYVLPGVCVEVYSIESKEGKVGIRNSIPWAHVRMAEEIMDAGTFVEEIIEAESDDDDEPDDDPEPSPPPQHANGAPSA